MNGDFLDALQQIAREKEMSQEMLLETVESALVTAYRKNHDAPGEITVRIDTANGSLRVYSRRTVVEEIENPELEIEQLEANRTHPALSIGDILEIDVTPPQFGRIAAQAFKQVVVQKIRDAERDRIFEEYNERIGDIVTGTVQRREFKNILISLGKIEALLPPQEQVDTEPYRFNDRIKVYMLEVRRTPKGPQVIVSRTHPSLIRRLFELEVPEIADGIVTIKSVAREPGARSKIAVYSRDEKVDPVGSCVGHRGARVQAVVNEMYDEKIDIVRWSADQATFIAESLSPAKAVKVTLNEDTKSAFVIVPDNQLSLAIGKSGQNVRLAARLTGWRIDIRSESQVLRAATGEGAPADEAVAHAHHAPPQAAATEPLTAEPAAAEPEPLPPAEVEQAGVQKADNAPREALIPTHAAQVDEDTPDDSLPVIELPDFDAVKR